MVRPLPISLGRGSNKADHGQAGLASFENCFAKDLGEEGKSSFTVQVINGCEEFAVVNTAGIETMFGMEFLLLTVAGNVLSSVSLDGGAVTEVGGLLGDGLVTMAANRRTPDPQVAIVRGSLWYVFSNGILTAGSDADLPPPIYVVEILGYFVFLIEDGRWFISSNNDILIDALDFAEAEASADKNVAAAVRGRTLFIFGTRSIEAWDVSGDATFPFAFTTSINMGCYAAGSVRNALIWQSGRMSDTVIWAATDQNGGYAGIFMLDGYQAVPISTTEVDNAVRDEPLKSSIRSMAWTEDGLPYYAIAGSTFTMVYAGKTGRWHRRYSGTGGRWYANCCAQFGSKLLFGHHSNGKVYESRHDLMDEAGNVIVMTIQPPPINTWPLSFKVPAIYIDMLVGVGKISGNEMDADPNLIVDYTTDGGVTWSAERKLPMGRIGENYRKLRVPALGRFGPSGFTLRMRCSARVSRGMQQLAIDVVPLR